MTLGDYYRHAPLAKPEPRCVTKTRKAKVDAQDERAARAAVKARDKGRCRIPNCNERAIHVHHIVFRSQSKRLRWRTENLLSLCGEHHQLAHSRIIEISGDADGEIVITGDTERLRFRL